MVIKMLNFLFGNTKAKKAQQAKPVKRNVYAAGYGTKPFPNAYYNTNRGTV